MFESIHRTDIVAFGKKHRKVGIYSEKQDKTFLDFTQVSTLFLVHSRYEFKFKIQIQRRIKMVSLDKGACTLRVNVLKELKTRFVDLYLQGLSHVTTHA